MGERSPIDDVPPAGTDLVVGGSPAGMTSRERVRAALAHREPDRTPFDLGGSRVTGIHVRAYRRLRALLGLPAGEPVVGDITQQLADVETDVLDALDCDVRGVLPRATFTYRREIREAGEYLQFIDEWGVGRRMPRVDGLYYDAYAPPLGGEVEDAAIDRYPWPDATDPARLEGMAQEARRYAREERRAVHVGSICGGLTEGLFKLRGFEDGYMDLAADPSRARRLMERILEIKLEYWSTLLPQLVGVVDVVGEADDLGGQDRTLFSPASYRALVKPLHRQLFAFLHAHTDAKVFFHTCGAVRELIPDLIEIGVDILNPVQVSAAGMDTAALQGGGTPAEVHAEVRRRVGDLAPGGGFVFAAVHNVQPNVPPENVLAMRRAVRAMDLARSGVDPAG